MFWTSKTLLPPGNSNVFVWDLKICIETVRREGFWVSDWMCLFLVWISMETQIIFKDFGWIIHFGKKTIKRKQGQLYTQTAGQPPATYSWTGCYVYTIFIKSGVIQHFSSNQRVWRPFSSRHAPVKCDAIICRQTQRRQPALKAFCPSSISLHFSSFRIPPWSSINNSSLKSSGGITSALYQNCYSCQGGVSQIGRELAPVHRSKRQKQQQIIPFTHVCQ